MGSTVQSIARAPLVSIVIVARNTGALIDAAIGTARGQTLGDIEIVVLDDASTDETRARAEAHAAVDARVRVLDGPAAGLAAVRNASLAAASGRYVAILDSDDMLHPRHLERLVEVAERTGAGMVAANMIEFRDSPQRHATLFAQGPGWTAEREIGMAEFIRANGLHAVPPTLGYIKPLIDLERLRAAGVTYDPRLRIGEDYDLVVRALAGGLRLRFIPEATYFYRRHDASTSHRLARTDLVGLIETAQAGSGGDPDVAGAIATRLASLDAALAHLDAVTAIKARRPAAALRALALPGAFRLMLGSIREGLQRRLSKPDRTAGSRQAPYALLLGSPAPGSRLDRCVDALRNNGLPVERHASPSSLVDGLTLAGQRIPAIVLIGDDAARDAAPFLLAPDALRIQDEDGRLTIRDGASGTIITTLDDEAGDIAQQILGMVRS